MTIAQLDVIYAYPRVAHLRLLVDNLNDWLRRLNIVLRRPDLDSAILRGGHHVTLVCGELRHRAHIIFLALLCVELHDYEGFCFFDSFDFFFGLDSLALALSGSSDK
uniref:Uncharacterized protein n=1 Tax=Favella ehrenbergii TaxID=182087 RepID=A0A7S3I599_9SPIT